MTATAESLTTGFHQILVAGEGHLAEAVRQVLSLLTSSCAEASASWPPGIPYLLVLSGSEKLDDWLTKSRRVNVPAMCLILNSHRLPCSVQLHLTDDARIVELHEVLLAAAVRTQPKPRNAVHLIVSLLSDINWHQLPSRVQDLFEGRISDQTKPQLAAVRSVTKTIRALEKAQFQNALRSTPMSAELEAFLQFLITEETYETFVTMLDAFDALLSGKSGVPPETRRDRLKTAFEISKELVRREARLRHTPAT